MPDELRQRFTEIYDRYDVDVRALAAELKEALLQLKSRRDYDVAYATRAIDARAAREEESIRGPLGARLDILMDTRNREIRQIEQEAARSAESLEVSGEALHDAEQEAP